MTALSPAVFRWSTPLVVPGPTPWPVAPLHRVVDLAPLRTWLDAHGYGDVTIIRGARIRLELPKTPQPARGEQLAGRTNETLPPAYSPTGPDLPVCGAGGAPCVDALPLES